MEYDGTDFAGFQVQPGARTVQGELEAALARLAGGRRLRVDGAGRTDAGVHASGQVIAFTYDGRLPAAELGRALDALLPADVAIRGLRRAPAGFHPRFAARYREYRYTVWNGPRSPLRERYALGVRDPLDTAAMARAGSVFIGRHDFCAFGAADRTPVRTVHAVRVAAGGTARDDRRRGPTPSSAGWSAGWWPSSWRSAGERWMTTAVAAALGAGRPALDGAMAPAQGLVLRRVVIGRRPPANERRTRRPMNAKTYTLRESEIERRWYVVDATDQTLGRLATRIARVLEGKHKPTYRRTSTRATTSSCSTPRRSP